MQPGSKTSAVEYRYAYDLAHLTNLTTFLSRDPFEGLPTRALSRNGYSWVEGNPINYVDPSGMCWMNSSSTQDQKDMCSDVWSAYMNSINAQHTTDWPRDIRILVTQEAGYWSHLSFNEFVNQWNGNRPPASLSNGGHGDDLVALGMLSLRAPALGIPGWFIAGAGVCLAFIGALAAASAIALPLRQTFDFSTTSEQVDEGKIRWPIPPTLDGPKVVLYRAIDPIELSFVRSVGFTNYGFSPSGGGKYFALTHDGATRFASADINSYAAFTITRIRVSPSIISLGYFFNEVGQQGAGWSIHFSDMALMALYADLIASNERIVIIGAR